MKTLIFTVLFSSNVHSYVHVDKFTKSIIRTCKNTKPLAVKKMLIEYLQTDNFCKKPFTGRIVKNCENLTCNKIKTIYSKLELENSGAIIGR